MTDGMETYEPEEQAEVRAAAEKKRLAKTRRLIGVGILAFVAAGAVMVFARPNLPGLAPRPPAAPKPALDTAVTARCSLPAVQQVWDQLDLVAMPVEVAQNLKAGRFYYDNRFPGNFGLAIGYWKQALALLAGDGRGRVESLVGSAQQELAGQFASDSGDAMVLLKQGKRAEAVVLLEKMRADFLDVNAPQYAWASQMLSRRRR